MFLDKIINTAYSFGAAVVVFGAWGKLEHKDFGDVALTAGLLTETAIFCLYGLLEWREKSPLEKTDQTNTAPGTSPVAGDLPELAAAVKQTNQILTKVFRTDS